MIIDSLNIYGFGKLQDVRINLSEGLNVIEGYNEAGKSTILAFIRAVFFGFENRRNPHLRYEPIFGGNFGGSITLKDNDGREYIVERIGSQKVAGEVKVYLPNGEQKGEDYIPVLIGKVNQKVYNQVFSFGLSELQKIDSLHDEEINDFIYHAGTGSVNQILKFKKHLEEEQQLLYKLSRGKSEISDTLNEINELEGSIDKIKQTNKRHSELTDSMETINKELDKIENILKNDQMELHLLEKTKQNLSTYKSMVQNEQELASFGEIPKFPEKGVERLEAILDKIKELETEIKTHEGRADKVKEEMNRIDFLEVLEENKDTINNLMESQDIYREQKDKAKSLQAEVEQYKEQITTSLNQLGSHYDRELLLKVDFTLNDKQYLQDLSEKIDKEGRSLEELNSQIEHKRNSILEYRRRIEKLKTKDDTRFDEKIEALSAAKNSWGKIQERQFKLDNFFDQKNRYQSQLDALNQKKPWSTYILGVALLAMIGFASYLDLIYGAGALIASVIIFIAFKLNGSTKAYKESLKTDISGINDQVERLSNEIVQLKSMALEYLMKFNIRDLNEQIVARLEKDIEEIKQDKEKYIQMKNRIVEYENEINALEVDLEQMNQQQLLPLKQELNKHKAEWENWLNEHYLQEGISHMVVYDTMSVIQSTKNLINKHDKLEDYLKKLQRDILLFENNLNAFIANHNLNIVGANDKKLILLTEALKENNEAKLLINEKKKQLLEIKQQLDILHNRLRIEKENKAELFKYAEAQSIDHYYAISKQHEKYNKLLDENRQLEAILKTTTSTEEEYGKLTKNLKNWLNSDIDSKVELLKQTIEEKEKKVKSSLEEKGQVQNQLKQMEEDNTLAEINQQLHEHKALLNKKLKKWSTLNFAMKLLERTMKVYETEKQPRVIKLASTYFSKMTNGAYKQIIAPLGSNQIEVVREDNQRFQPQYLSRGTIEQLFLAMRFALVEEFSNQMALPIILDDIFVNFDSIRLKNALTALNELSQKHQVVFFTCHEHVANQVREINQSNREQLVLQ